MHTLTKILKGRKVTEEAWHETVITMMAILVAGILAITTYLGTPGIVESQLIKGTLLIMLSAAFGFDVFLFGENTGIRNRDVLKPNQALEAIFAILGTLQGLSYLTDLAFNISFMNLGNGLEAILLAVFAISGLWERLQKH